MLSKTFIIRTTPHYYYDGRRPLDDGAATMPTSPAIADAYQILMPFITYTNGKNEFQRMMKNLTSIGLFYYHWRQRWDDYRRSAFARGRARFRVESRHAHGVIVGAITAVAIAVRAMVTMRRGP